MSHDIVHSLFRRVVLPALVAMLAVGVEGGFDARHAAAAGPELAAVGHPASELTLRRQVAVDGSSVRLGDIFDGAIAGIEGVDADTVVAYAPQPGRRAVFDADWLARTAMRYRLHWRPATRLDRVIVERASTVIGAEIVTEALLAEITGRGYGEDYELELSNRNLMLHIDSRAPATVEIVNLSVDEPTERFSAIVAAPAGDPHAVRTTVAGRLYALVEVPVPARTLRPGETIRESDIRWQAVRARRVRGNMVTDAGELIGQEPVRALRAETPVRRNDLRDPVTVAKGSTVTMTYETPAMRLSAVGHAEQNGSTGEIISVRNIQTKLVVEARVVGPSRVAVPLAPRTAFNQGLAN